jgi:hypothetical protein
MTKLDIKISYLSSRFKLFQTINNVDGQDGQDGLQNSISGNFYMLFIDHLPAGRLLLHEKGCDD